MSTYTEPRAFLHLLALLHFNKKAGHEVNCVARLVHCPCIYLSSRAGAYCTGTVLVVDGGIVGAAKIQLDSHL
jgi:hypothetical protein